MLRKLIICLLLGPMPLNGLWLACRDAASKAEDPPEASILEPLSEIDSSLTGTDSSLPAPDCSKECAWNSAAKDGVVCIISTGDRTSFSIVVFGVPLLPPEIRVLSPGTSGRFIAELPDTYSSPTAARPTPPPEA